MDSVNKSAISLLEMTYASVNEGLSYLDFLSPNEIEVSKKHSKVKYQNWFVGRVAIKRAFFEYINKRTKKNVKLNSIEIVSRAFGRPYIKISPLSGITLCEAEKLEKSVNFSLSHSDGHAVASLATTKQCGHVGVDIERVRSFNPLTLRKFLTFREHAELQCQLQDKRPQYATLLWSIKEAYLKAIGKGLLVHPRRIEVSNYLTPNECSIRLDGYKIDATVQRSFLEEGKYVITKILVSSENKCTLKKL